MQKMKPRGSEPKRGWPSKQAMADRSGEVFSLDFLFIEHGVRPQPQLAGSFPSVGFGAVNTVVGLLLVSNLK